MEVKFLSIAERDKIIADIFVEIKNGQEAEPSLYQFKNAREWFKEFIMTNMWLVDEMTGENDPIDEDTKLYVMQDYDGNILACPQSEFVVQYWVP